MGYITELSHTRHISVRSLVRPVCTGRQVGVGRVRVMPEDHWCGTLRVDDGRG